MSFSGNMAYGLLRIVTAVFPAMKADFTDLPTELEKARKINEKNRYVFPSDKKSLYKEIRTDGYPCLIIRSRKTKNKKDKGLLFIYGGNTLQWKSELAMARYYGDRTGMDVWYPVYPPITEVNITVTTAVLCDVYDAMVKKRRAEHRDCRGFHRRVVGGQYDQSYKPESIGPWHAEAMDWKLSCRCAGYTGGLA